MNTKEHSGPAFPYSTKNPSGTDKEICGVNVPNGCQVDFPGMTLRDYFAAKVLSDNAGMGGPEQIAKFAYQVADAMLAERAK